MRKFTFREIILVAVILVMGLGYFAYDAVYLQLKESKKDLRNKVKVSEALLLRHLNDIKLSARYDAQYDQMLNKFKQKISNERAMSAILSEIEAVANESKMRISQMKPQKVKQVDFYNNFSVSLNVEGSVQDVMQFLHTLQNDKYLYKVDELQISKVSPRIADLRCQFIVSKVLIP